MVERLQRDPSFKDAVRGKDGSDGKDGAPGRAGAKGQPGKDAEIDYDLLVQKVIERLPPINVIAVDSSGQPIQDQNGQPYVRPAYLGGELKLADKYLAIPGR